MHQWVALRSTAKAHCPDELQNYECNAFSGIYKGDVLVNGKNCTCALTPHPLIRRAIGLPGVVVTLALRFIVFSFVQQGKNTVS